MGLRSFSVFSSCHRFPQTVSARTLNLPPLSSLHLSCQTLYQVPSPSARSLHPTLPPLLGPPNVTRGIFASNLYVRGGPFILKKNYKKKRSDRSRWTTCLKFSRKCVCCVNMVFTGLTAHTVIPRPSSSPFLFF